jgi:hypothetical protein
MDTVIRKLRALACIVWWFGHRTVQTRGGYYCDRCGTPRPRGW